MDQEFNCGPMRGTGSGRMATLALVKELSQFTCPSSVHLFGPMKSEVDSSIADFSQVTLTDSGGRSIDRGRSAKFT